MRPVQKTSCHAYQTLGFAAVLSHRLCAAIRWPLTRARAGLARPGNPLRLPPNYVLFFFVCVGATLAVARRTKSTDCETSDIGHWFRNDMGVSKELL